MTDSDKSGGSRVAWYQQEIQQRNQLIQELDRVCRLGSVLRGVLFLIVGTLFFLAFFNYREWASIWWTAFGLAVFAFLGVVIVHQAYEDRRLYHLRWRGFFEQALYRLERDWDRIQVQAAWTTQSTRDQVQDLMRQVGYESHHPQELEKAAAVDLDLEGKRSLWQLINLAKTEVGQELLSRWMFLPATADEIRARQSASTAIADANDWRQDFLMACQQTVTKDSSPSNIVRWAEGDPLPGWLTLLVYVARVNAVVMVALLVLWFSGWFAAGQIGLAIVVVVGINFLVSVVSAGSIHEIFQMVGVRTHDVVRYRHLLEQVDQAPGTSGSESGTSESSGSQSMGNRLRQGLHQVDGAAWDYRQGMRTLVQLSTLSNLRGGMTFLVYVVMQFLFLWDLHVLDRLEQWRKHWGHRVPHWFHALGYFEALACLGQFQHDHQDWIMPTVFSPNDNDSASQVTAQQVAHPLLGQEAVANDVRMGCDDQTLLVTGSNMSGKSTYLRTIGVNLILARMGTVVRAKTFSCPAVAIGTSMRVADSLSDGISFFMSELKRLKQIVDQAKAFQADAKIQYVYLLDEILQGTNSRERQIAVTRVTEQLIKRKAIGALSTHDLQLPEVEALAGKLDIVHFKESFQDQDGRQIMVFDYLMRPGMTPTTNALKLLALVGLDESE